MSERVSSVEIEDVLSSIRRLVSEELRPMQPAGRSMPAAARGAEFEEEPEAEPVAVSRPVDMQNRLVLTASLRVLPPEAGDEEPAPESAAGDTTSPEARADIWQDAETWEESWEQEGEDPLAGASWATSAPAADSAASAAPAASNEDDEPADALPPAPGHRFSFSVARSAFDEDETRDVPPEPAAPEPAAPEPAAAEEPEPGSRLELTADLAISSAPWAQPVAGNRDEAVSPRAEPEAPPEDFRAREDAAWADLAAAEAIQDVEASTAGRPTAAPEEPVRAAPLSIAEADPAPARVSYLHRAEPSEPRLPGPQSGALDNPDEAPEELILEEAALREIIRDVVREELAGSLGGRITRNVRKLVRAEIAQMLASRTLE